MRELQGPGELLGAKQFPFDFSRVEKPYESYEGINARLRYFLRVTISRQYSSKIVHEETFRVFVTETEAAPETASAPIKMEVGIEDCLHIEFEYNKSRYALKDVVLGKIFFLLVRIRIKSATRAVHEGAQSAWRMGGSPWPGIRQLVQKGALPARPQVGGGCVARRICPSHQLSPPVKPQAHAGRFMELAIIKRESTTAGSNTFNESETVAKFEIMDGAPVRGDSSQ